jgi:hypothetical protein
VKITITKQMIADEICCHLCYMAEASQDRSFELDHKFVFIKNWNGEQPLTVTYGVVLKGYHAFDGNKAARIPEFISKDWQRALKIYKRLKHL